MKTVYVNWLVYFLLLFLFYPTALWAQKDADQVHGKVNGVTEENQIRPLAGANVHWLGTAKGTYTDEDGNFIIERVTGTSHLVVSFIGYPADTVDVSGENHISVNLNATVELDEVKFTHRRNATEISGIETLKTEKINEKELQKAACCNLSESFETNPSVDLSYTDAITGTRQIRMLGLAGPYTQITRENMPDVRGLSAIYGLTYIPGTWVESIQLNKGAGTVVNGYESIAGQINVELRKPERADRLYLNAFGNKEGRLEGNVNFAHRFKEGKWSTALLLHGKNNSIKWDRNNDGFMDHPLSSNFIGLNRWKYIGSNGVSMQFGVKGTYIDNIGGEIAFNPEEDLLTTNHWGMQMNIQRFEGWAKVGKVYEHMPWKSMGIQLSGAVHEQNSYFGLNKYDAGQNTFYANYVYQSIIGNTNHKFKTGASFQYDNYIEWLNNTAHKRTEIVPGGFFEYTFDQLDKFDAIAGIRADYHNLFGPFVTPRLHLRYEMTDQTDLRASGGRGMRTANILSENSGLLASSRQIVIEGDNSNKPFGLKPEIAWNYGINLTHCFQLYDRNGTVSFDLYRTDFMNQIVTDLDQSPQKVVFYNLNGRSYSNSFQAQLDYEVFKRFNTRLAYRWYDVHTTYDGKLMQKPLLSKHRAFLNLAYETRNQWKFDYTINWQGRKRIPYTASNPDAYQLPERSPDFVLMNAQISKKWGEYFEVYTGVENLLGYRQDNPILSSEKPFSPYFDSSLIWGPVFGRKTYIGLRYHIK